VPRVEALRSQPGGRDVALEKVGPPDAADEETYKFIHQAPVFSKIVRNLEALTRIKKEMGSELPVLNLGFVAMKANIDQLPEFIHLASCVGAATVGVGHLTVFRESLRDQSLVYHREHANEILIETRKVADELGIQVNLPEPFNTDVDPWNHEFAVQLGVCREPWEFVYVDNVGTVRPCCIHETVVGDLHKQSFDEIWNGESYRRFRAVVNTSKRYGMCLKCFDYRYRDPDNPRQYFHIQAD